MVEAARVDGTGDAASRSAARRHAARSTLAALLRDTNGATSIEYALIASLVSILIIAGVTQVGTTIRDNFFNKIAANL
jgi:Flp pilus assembly pilin Flp